MAIRVLIADDHGSFRRALRTALEHSKVYQICGEAKDGIEAARLAQGSDPDVIILDLLMPGLNGFNAAKQIREVLPDTPIVLLTLYDNRQVKLEAERCGISAVISKTQPGRLLSVLDEALSTLAQPAPSNAWCLAT
ncbi:MAG TPA: response regulator transcription factor [Terriglobales bacterium]|nr:response regulator transcription factor [Terriglobales bacterium]